MANEQPTSNQSRNPRHRQFWFWRGLRFIGFGLLLGVLAGFVVMGLWNALLPDILGVSAITFWQALGLLLLSRILFGRYGGAGRGFGRGADGGREWKQKMAGRWRQLTPEQREQMQQNWRDRCKPRSQPPPPNSPTD
ncbi:MAG: hypothetical protein H7319_13115 [Spirosoma sp.]|nr:hypothetical protein [Spirosoma sp.]